MSSGFPIFIVRWEFKIRMNTDSRACSPSEMFTLYLFWPQLKPDSPWLSFFILISLTVIWVDVIPQFYS